MERITRENMFFEILETIKKRGTCNRKQVAALIEMDGRIISIGYAGAPSLMAHCLDVGCELDEYGGCVRTAHAEANAIAFAAKNGISTDGATMYCTLSPCLHCAKLIANSGIVELHYREPYRDKSGIILLNNAGVRVYEQ